MWVKLEQHLMNIKRAFYFEVALHLVALLSVFYAGRSVRWQPTLNPIEEKTRKINPLFEWLNPNRSQWGSIVGQERCSGMSSLVGIHKEHTAATAALNRRFCRSLIVQQEHQLWLAESFVFCNVR